MKNYQYLVQFLGTRAHFFEECVENLGCKVERIASPKELKENADICLISGVHYIIKPQLLNIPRLGIWGFHETALPQGRGCAPLQWTVLHGIPQLTVSFFELVEEFDSGRLLGQLSSPIARTDLLEDLRSKADDLIKQLIEKYLLKFLSGECNSSEQIGASSYNRKRTPADSQLDPSKTLSELWDVIRICDNEQFPAWFEVDGDKFILKRFRMNTPELTPK